MKLIPSIFIIVLLLSCTGSDVSITTYKNETKVELSNFSFEAPSNFFVTQSLTTTINLTKVSGPENFDLNYLTQSSNGDAICNTITAINIESDPQLTLSDCNGDGGLILSYNNSSSLKYILVIVLKMHFRALLVLMFPNQAIKSMSLILV